jgi:hypothetical protein
VKFSNCEF